MCSDSSAFQRDMENLRRELAEVTQQRNDYGELRFRFEHERDVARAERDIARAELAGVLRQPPRGALKPAAEHLLGEIVDSLVDHHAAGDASTRTAPALLVFLHIAKSGGTTLAEILGRQFPAASCFNAHLAPSETALGVFPEAPIARKVDSLDAAQLDALRFVGGHLMFGVHRHFRRSAEYLTMLREPVDRVISSYYYIRRQEGIPVGRTIREQGLTLEQYARSGLGLDPHNYQTRILAGLPSLDSDWQHTRETLARPITRAILDLAKQNIVEHIPIVGVTERFDESLVLAALRYRWRPSTLAYARRNETEGRPSIEDIPMATREYIQECNQWDIELYEFARERLGAQWASAGIAATEYLTLLRVAQALRNHSANTT